MEEEFDPQSLHEDLLLIEPLFPPPSPEPGLPAGDQDAAHDATSPESDEPASAPVQPASAPAQPAALFHVRLMTLASIEEARQRRDELGFALGIPVWIERHGDLLALLAGTFPSADEAESLRARLAPLGREYADARVVGTGSAETASGAEAPAADDADGEPAQAMETLFGWRIRLDKLESYEQAEKLRQNAVKQLRRADIDITFTPPYYNVEVGYYRTEAEAQESLERFRRRYRNALKVRSQIFAPVEE